ncbi:MAG: thioesterase family protein, partial [Ruminococcus sp.]|nr:thioesterase family protein [Ruminococcus sp.]
MANYYETDQMGVVHHSNHIRYFEEARLDFMRTIGCDAAEMEKDGIIIPNVDAYAKYEKPVRFADRVSIAVRLVKFSGATM